MNGNVPPPLIITRILWAISATLVVAGTILAWRDGGVVSWQRFSIPVKRSSPQ
jgi:hypothetical protein